MTTYSFIKYDVLKDIMYFKSTPTPDFKQTVKTEGISTEQDREYIEGIQSSYNNLIPQDAFDYIKLFLQGIPELDLNNSKNITLKVAIDEDTNAVGDVLIISQNLNRTLTTLKLPGNWPSAIGILIKPIKKWPTLGKCKNCLKFTFQKDHIFNFVGNIGGQWDNTWRNGQKVYRVDIPNYSFPFNGATTDYRIFWKPNITYSGTDYNGQPFTITNQNKWIAVPSSSIGTVNELSNTTFFHILSNTSASCPFTPNPTNPNWNFRGNQGFFLLELANTGITEFGSTKCPTFTPTPGNVEWGYNCGPNGCVASPSGSVGTYATLAQCQVSCSIPDPTPVTSWRCLSGDCIEISGSGGQFATEAECLASGCENVPVEPPIIYECVDGKCYAITSGSVATGSFFATLIDCQTSCSVPPVPTYEYLCTPNGCVQYPSGSLTGSFFTSLDECNAVCNQPQPTECNCTEPLVNIANPSFTQGSTSWYYSPNQPTPGIGGWSFNSSNATAGVLQQFNSFNISNVYLSQPNILNISCSYQVCFQAWTGVPNSSCGVSVGTGNYTNNLAPITTPLTTIPTAYTFTISNVETNDLVFYAGLFSGSSNSEIYIDNICVTLIGCPPPQEPAAEDCYITGSAYSYTSASYDCLCPEGYTSDGNGNCIQSGSLTINANAGITGSIPSINSLIIPGLSINQPVIPGYTFDPNNTTGIIPAYVGALQPVLYYDWNFDGTGDSSINNTSSYFGSPRVYNTQYTFDILSSSFWYQPELGQNWPAKWVAQLVRQTSLGNFDTGTRWSGFGTTLNVPSPKTYYIGIIGQGAMKIKLDGTTILCTSPSETSSFAYDQPPIGYYFPAYQQNMYARVGEYPNGNLQFGILPPPLYSLNTNILGDITGACYDFLFQNSGIECAPYAPTSAWGKFSSGYNLYIYPVTMSAGCHKLNFESSTKSPDKYCNYNSQGFIGAVIFDMSADQLVNADSYGDLNIVWDSTYLEPITTNNNLYGADYYMYSYDIGIIPSASFYTSYCPTGSTPIGGDPCNGCTTTQSVNISIPCGNCVDCTNGFLYNGYVVDKGGATLQGRGPGGIVNTGSINASTWVIPTESDWNDLVTFLNNGTAPTSVTVTGSLGTIAGGKLKDYTRDLRATCWENPNIGAQTDVSSSGWAGTAGGRRKDNGVFEGLGFEGLWWSANSLSTPPTSNGSLMATRRLEHYSPDVFRDIFPKNYGCSIRLVRPATANETNGSFIPGAYTGKDGKLYDGIVINNQVWITKNLSETLYNNGSSITNTTANSSWYSSIISAAPTSCYYNNNVSNVNIINGNINPVTQECYEFPRYYVYTKCGGSEFLVQTVSGSTMIVGETLKDSNYDCWSFFETTQGIPTYPHTFYNGNYFANSNVVYNNCEECQAIHSIYMTFGTKNC